MSISFFFAGCVFGLGITLTSCVFMKCQLKAFCFWKGDMEAQFYLTKLPEIIGAVSAATFALQ